MDRMERMDFKDMLDKIIILAASAVILMAMLFFTIYHLSSPRLIVMECTGELSGDLGEQTDTVYINIVEYKWWLTPVKHSDGQLFLEILDYPRILYNKIRKDGVNLYIYRQGKLSGNLFIATKDLNIDVGKIDSFQGSCVPFIGDAQR